jgi:hypothetical protein
MSIIATILITVTPDASARVAQLRLEHQFDQMLEHTHEVITGLRAITVSLAPPYDTGDEPCGLIEPTSTILACLTIRSIGDGANGWCDRFLPRFASTFAWSRIIEGDAARRAKAIASI